MKQWLIPVCILLVAFVMRLQSLPTVPPGLSIDEAHVGHTALQALNQGYQFAYVDGSGTSGLWVYLQSLPLSIFGNQIWALHLMPILAGILTILGLYLLTRKLFNWQIAAIASFLLAISFWHVLLSRVGLDGILVPLFAIWGFYLLWEGLSSGNQIFFATSGVFWGLGMYTSMMFWPTLIAGALVLWAYQYMIAKDYNHDTYAHLHHQIASGLGGLLVVFIITTLPIALPYYVHPTSFVSSIQHNTILGSGDFARLAMSHVGQVFGELYFGTTQNWLYGIAGQSILYWPIGVLFFLGLIKTFMKLSKRWQSHGHLSTVQTLLIVWLIAGLIPAILSNSGPNAYLPIQAIPAIYIIIAEGLWWLYDFARHWQRVYDIYHVSHTAHPNLENRLVATIALLVLLGAFGIAEYQRYFNTWGKAPEVAKVYSITHLE